MNNQADFVDFHTHLDWYQNQQELKLQLQAFTGIIVAASVDANSYKANIKLAEQFANSSVRIIPTFGIHPEKAAEAPGNLSELDDFCVSSPLIGEIGMDFCWYKNVPALQQEKVFRYFLEHCHNYKKHCVIHTKDAEEQICRILEEYPNAKPIVHWYDGPEDVYQEFIKRGYYQTFGCETSRSEHIQKLLKQTPERLILAETDNPTAEPWLGGTDSSVQLISRIYSDIAKVLCKPEDWVRGVINENGKVVLGPSTSSGTAGNTSPSTSSGTAKRQLER